MADYRIDLIFDEQSGSVEFIIDRVGAALTPLDIREGIADGSLKQDVIDHVRSSWGEDMAKQLENGSIGLRCSDADRNEQKQVQELLNRIPADEGSSAHTDPLRNQPNLPNQTEGNRNRQGHS